MPLRLALAPFVKTFLFANFLAPAVLGALTVTSVSAPKLFVDAGNNLRGNYVGWALYNNGNDIQDLWVGLGGFSGGNAGLAPYESGTYHIGPLANGVTRTAFYYLQATATASAQGATLSFYNAKPPATAFQTQAVSWTQVESVGQNASNKVNVVVSGPNPPALGGEVNMTVTGDSGQLGSQALMAFTPASYLDWAADKFQLFTTDLSWGSGRSAQNLLAVTGTTNADEGAYTIIYRFRALGATSVQSTVSPIGYFAQGSGMGHTDTGNYGIGANFLPTTTLDSYITVSKSASLLSVVWPVPVQYTLAVRNTGIYSATLDQLVDQLPVSPGQPSIVTGSSTWDGAPIADPVLSGSALTWSGQFVVPADTTLELSFQTVLAPLAGTYANTAYGWIGNLRIDRTLDATDNSPTAWTVSQLMPTATPSFTLSPSATISPTPTESFTQVPPGSTLTDTPTASPTASPSATASPSSTRSPTRTITLTRTPSPSFSPSPAGTATHTPSRTTSPTRTTTETATPTASPSATPTGTESPTLTATRTATASPTFSHSPTESPTFSLSPTFSFSPTQTQTFTDSPTPTATRTATPTPTDSPTGTPTATPTATRTITATFTHSPTASPSFTITQTHTFTPTVTPTATVTPTFTPVTAPVLADPYPNPFRPLKGQRVNLRLGVAVAGTAKVKVFNLAGELVRRLYDAPASNGTLAITWDGRNDQGDFVASGTYLLVAETPSGALRALVGVIK